jgi:hypothetical protein
MLPVRQAVIVMTMASTLASVAYTFLPRFLDFTTDRSQGISQMAQNYGLVRLTTLHR